MIWQEPFIVRAAPPEDPCVVASCKWKGRARWEVEVVGYYGRKDPYPEDETPKFTACSSHLTQQLNRFVDVR